MAYKVFISYSTQDQSLVRALARLLKKSGVEVFVAEWYPTPGEPINKKVFTQLEKSDCMVVLLTRNGIRSKWVHQEVGYMIKVGKPIIPIVEKGISQRDLAALQGKEYIEYDPSRRKESLDRASKYINSLKLKKEEQEIRFIIGLIVAFILLFWVPRQVFNVQKKQ